LELAQAEQQLQEVTRRGTTADALAWISEGRSIARPFDLPVLLSALAAVADQATDSRLAELADRALNLVCRAEVRSELDPSTELLALETVTRPAQYRAALDALAARTASRTLDDVTLAAVSGAQGDDRHVMATLCAVAGLSYRDLKSRTAPIRLPGNATGQWQHGQLQAAFAVIDKIVKGSVASSTAAARPMRPVEHLLPDVDDPDRREDRRVGWALVEDLRAHGVPFEVFLTQRAVGSSWGAHRNSTSNLVQAEVTTALCDLLAERGVPFDRLSRNAASRELLARVGAGPAEAGEGDEEQNEGGQVTVLIHNDEGFAHAIVVSVARDGGTASKSGAKLALVPARLGIPSSVVLVGPGWAQRNETSDLVRAFSGRVYTERTLASLASMLEAAARVVGTGPENMGYAADGPQAKEIAQ
jgi:hypothetical protein